jgi:hypothetical protein
LSIADGGRLPQVGCILELLLIDPLHLCLSIWLNSLAFEAGDSAAVQNVARNARAPNNDNHAKVAL